MNWQQVLQRMPLIAILRGIEPEEAGPVADALRLAGFLCVEVPLNSPRPLATIQRLRAHCDSRLLVGAGTVLREADVRAVEQAGAQFVVSPNTNVAVIETTKTCGLVSIPGFVTATEAFVALAAGADSLKLFPADGVPPAILGALRAVLPNTAPVLPVGGITTANMRAYHVAGAAGFGIGSALYAPGFGAHEVGIRAAAFVAAWHALQAGRG
jgi:2-dehydro-3-deoxyphosphogalactonate aldolase